MFSFYLISCSVSYIINKMFKYNGLLLNNLWAWENPNFKGKCKIITSPSAVPLPLTERLSPEAFGAGSILSWTTFTSVSSTVLSVSVGISILETKSSLFNVFPKELCSSSWHVGGLESPLKLEWQSYIKQLTNRRY